MRNTTQKYKLENGILEINNSQIKISYRKLRYVLDIFIFFASIAFIASFIKKIQNFNNLNETYELVLFWFFGLSSCILVYFFTRSLFKKIWFNTIELNDLIKIEIEDDYEDHKNIDEYSKIELTFYKNNGREKIIELKKENNQLENFLDAIKIRNTRIKIEQL
tara:strand:- start:716 stop:1204 length:489 start_codon:yes stop_codon:yes gene_type:complete